jgi:hypothetical protein
MIKKTLAIFFALIFLVLKKIFIKKNRIPNKTMDTFSNKLHSMFIFTSFPALYLLWFEIEIYDFSINQAIYVLLFLQMLIIIRYFNPKMLVVKETQVKILKIIKKVALLIFAFNWIVFSFGFAFSFIVILLFNNAIYLFIINQINKQKEKEEFKKQFGEGNYTKEDIVKKHIINLFESDFDVKELSKSDIKKQYRTMAKKYHPDVYDGAKQDKFASINTSYKFLTDLIK